MTPSEQELKESIAQLLDEHGLLKFCQVLEEALIESRFTNSLEHLLAYRLKNVIKDECFP